MEIESKSFYGIPLELLEKVWPSVWPLIKLSLDRSLASKYYHEYDIFEALTHRDMQLWVATKDDEIVAAFVTQIVIYPRMKAFDIILVGGSEVDHWIEEAWGELKDYARSYNCQIVRGFGRAGWQRKLGREFQNSVVWECEL